MNKKTIIKRLQDGLNYEEDKCKIIISILEDTFIIGRKNKNKMIDRFIHELNVDESEANKIYESVIEIIGSGIKEKLIHPFKKE